MARLQQLSLVVSLVSLAPPVPAFMPSSAPGVFRSKIHVPVDASKVTSLHPSSGGSRLGPRPLLASAKPNVKDTTSVISEMEEWARLITPEIQFRRSFKYIVSAGTSLPEVFFDFWKAVSDVIDEHRSTVEEKSFGKMVMFVAPFCEELRDYETMEHAHQLLQQSAQDGGCDDFGKAITYLHYHPTYRHRPRPKEARLGSRHSPHPSFSIEAMYRSGGLKSLASIRAASEAQAARPATQSPTRLRPRADAPGEGRANKGRKNDHWVSNTRHSLEKVYNMAASYGAEDVIAGGSSTAHPLAGKGVPESSQEVLQLTKDWVKSVLKDAAESDTAASTLKKAEAMDGESMSPLSPSTTNASSSLPTLETGGSRLFSSSNAAAVGQLARDRSTAFKPPTAAEAAAAAAAAVAEEAEAATGGALAAEMIDSKGMSAGNAPRKIQPPRLKTAAGGLKQAFAHAAERVTVREDSRRGGAVKEKEEEREAEKEEREEGEGSGEGEEGVGAVLLPGKELVKRMADISQYIVARSKTAEEAYSDVWEVIAEMAERAARQGCSVPTADYGSSSAPCYGALVVTPDLATYSSDTFLRFQETLNRGLKHLPMEHDISIEAFHPEAVSEASPLDHRFTRSPFPTLHISYHGLRTADTPLHPKAPRKGTAAAAGGGAAAGAEDESG